MRRSLLLLLILLWMLPVLAQDDANEPNPDALNAAVDEAEAAADSAWQAVDEARFALDTASNFLGLFEAFGLVITVVGAAAALFGVTRLLQARSELTETRNQIESELKQAQERYEEALRQRQDEFEELERSLEASIENQKIVTSNAVMAQALLPLGERQYRTQDYTGAMNTYEQASALDPHNPVIQYHLGYVAIHSGNLDEAHQHFSAAIDAVKDFAPALAGLGFTYRRIAEGMDDGIEKDQMLNKAEALLLEALQISPRLVDDDNESWWGILGGLYRRRGQIDQAIHAYTQATKVSPESSYGYGNLALLYMMKNDREKMLEIYERVERLAYKEASARADNFWGYADLAVSRYALGKTKEAEEVLPIALEISAPDSPYMLEGMQSTLEDLKNILEKEKIPPIEKAIKKIEDYRKNQHRQMSASA